MKSITLTIQSNGSGGWRLGINCKNSKTIFRYRKVKVFLYLPNHETIECYTACGNPSDKYGKWMATNPKTGMPYRKKGYDLNKKELSKWIVDNYINIEKNKERSVKFNYKKLLDCYHLYFDCNNNNQPIPAVSRKD